MWAIKSLKWSWNIRFYFVFELRRHINKKYVVAQHFWDSMYISTKQKKKVPLDYSSLVVFQGSTHLIHCTAVVVAAHGVEALCIEKNKLQRVFFSLNRIMLWI